METILNENQMIINFFLAILLISLTIATLITIDRASTLVTGLVRSMLRFTRRSKLLTEYILRAYLRYRKTVSKPLVHNAY